MDSWGFQNSGEVDTILDGSKKEATISAKIVSADHF